MERKGAARQKVVEEHTTAVRIVDALKRDLINGTLAPDTLIVESQIGARFGVSKTPAREALLRLSEMGFVTVIPGKGYTVTKLSWQQIKDLFEVRLLLECSAVELAVARASPADLEELKAAAVLPRRPSVESLLDANLRFHRTIWKATRNGRLVQMVSDVMDDLMRAMHTAMLSEDIHEMAKQHLELTTLIAKKKTVEARAAMAEHVDATRRRLLDL
ncbi:MAG: transcriptional regulator, GntR family [Xanthobacteraceae bacterium]|nr:transcriptional regulator, GntR family [Xanthobacteraceae bacterium]